MTQLSTNVKTHTLTVKIGSEMKYIKVTRDEADRARKAMLNFRALQIGSEVYDPSSLKNIKKHKVEKRKIGYILDGEKDGRNIVKRWHTGCGHSWKDNHVGYEKDGEYTDLEGNVVGCKNRKGDFEWLGDPL